MQEFFDSVSDIADRHGWNVTFQRPPVTEDGVFLAPGEWRASIALNGARGTYYATVPLSLPRRITPPAPPPDPLAPKRRKPLKPPSRLETHDEYTARLYSTGVAAMCAARKHHMASWVTDTPDTSMAGYRLPMIRRRQIDNASSRV